MESFLVALPVLLLSVVIHEVAHGWVALKQGDPTAAMLGRITLNPLPHIDPFGSVLFPLLLAFTQAGVIFGWARPVPINPRNFRNYRRGDILVSLAGVAANFCLAIVFTVVVVLLIHLGRAAPVLGPSVGILVDMARYGVLINLVLVFFNLIPIPPLDGSHVVYHLLPPRLGARYRELSRYGILILLAILLFAPSVLVVVSWPVRALQDLSEAFIRLWV
ncbi:MAG TPA: site-2 protease family protein [Longimicrobiales bacterium]